MVPFERVSDRADPSQISLGLRAEMRVLQIYNQQRSEGGGEENVVRDTIETLRRAGIDVKLHMVSSRGIESSLRKKLHAAANTIYSRSAYREMKELLKQYRPDVAHAHNLYPLLSPSVLVACRESNVPVVFSAHSQVLTCPTWHHEYKGRICERCVGGNEYWCIVQNCRSNILESSLYAARSAYARIRQLFADNVTLFVVMSQFMRNRLITQGYASERVVHVPTMIRPSAGLDVTHRTEYVGYVGRHSSEKGLSVLMGAARETPSVPYNVAGHGPLTESLMATAPPNVRFAGFVRRSELGPFYRSARLLALPSLTFEGGLPLAALEAMMEGTPVVASRLGSIPEVVVDGVTGRLFEAGNGRELARAITDLWSNPPDAMALGKQARDYVLDVHSPEAFLHRTVEVYERAMDLI